MGRFSKLETGANSEPVPAPAGPAGGRPMDEPGIAYDAGYYLGEAARLYFSGNAQKALRIYSRAAQMDHSQVDAWVGQVLCLLELKQYKEALVWVKRGLELFPEEPRLISLEGAVYANQGMTQRGLGCSDFAMSKPGADALSWVLRGEILGLADNKNAPFCFQKAMEVKRPEDWQTPMQAGLLLLRQKKWPLAADYLKSAAEINPHNQYLWMRLGYAYERLGLTQLALEAYNAAGSLGTTGTAADDAISRISQTPLLVRFFRRVFG
jgi:tetratricopeptide (TPR) repeat protein